MKPSETNTSDTSINRKDVWAENPWNLPYDLNHVDKVRTTPPTEDDFWGEPEKETSLASRTVRSLGHAALRGVRLGAAAGVAAMAAVPAAALGVGTTIELAARGVNATWSIAQLPNTNALLERDEKIAGKGRKFRSDLWRVSGPILEKAHDLATEPTHEPDYNKELEIEQANFYREKAQNAHKDGDYQATEKNMEEAKFRKRLVESRKRTGIGAIKQWWSEW